MLRTDGNTVRVRHFSLAKYRWYSAGILPARMAAAAVS